MVSNLLAGERTHLNPTEGIDAQAMGAEDAHYTEPFLDPQWAIAYKLFTDDKGVYGLPYPVPIGEWMGGSALSRMKRRDGGPAWSATKPDRVGASGSIECVAERCGDAHLGGKRKMLVSLQALIKHVESFHPDEYDTYKKYFDKVKDDLALENPRLQRVMRMAAGEDEVAESVVAALNAEADDSPTPVILPPIFACIDCEWVPKENAINPASALASHRAHRHKAIPPEE